MIEVTQAMFFLFLSCTGYVTDAEKFGWSFEQKTVTIFDVVEENCRTEKYEDNVIHVSWNDAQAYCDWSNTRLPTEKEYWQLATKEQKNDVWDWSEEGFLLGGSYLCNQMCQGWKKGTKRIVSKNTSNSHIGFCVIDENQ